MISLEKEMGSGLAAWHLPWAKEALRPSGRRNPSGPGGRPLFKGAGVRRGFFGVKLHPEHVPSAYSGLAQYALPFIPDEKKASVFF